MLSLDVIRKLTGVPQTTSDQTLTDLRDQLYLIAQMAVERTTGDQNSRDTTDEQS